MFPLSTAAVAQGLGLAAQIGQPGGSEVSGAEQVGLVDVYEPSSPELQYWDFEPLCSAAELLDPSFEPDVTSGRARAAMRVRVVVDDGLPGTPCAAGAELSATCEASPASLDVTVWMEDTVESAHFKLPGARFTFTENSGAPPTVSGLATYSPAPPRDNAAADPVNGNLW